MIPILVLKKRKLSDICNGYEIMEYTEKVINYHTLKTFTVLECYPICIGYEIMEYTEKVINYHTLKTFTVFKHHWQICMQLAQVDVGRDTYGKEIWVIKLGEKYLSLKIVLHTPSF